MDLRKSFLLRNPDWKYDNPPEIFEGQNIADFIDPDIEKKLKALEKEEELLVRRNETFGSTCAWTEVRLRLEWS